MRIIALILVFAAAPALAQPGGSFGLGAASGYVWRGIAQTDQDIVYQAHARYQDAAGFYVQAAAADIARASYPVAGEAGVRVDAVAGMQVRTKGALGWDLGVNIVRFDKSELGFEEAFLALAYGEWRAQVAHDWENDNTYARAGAELDLGSGIILTLFGGRFAGDTVRAYKDYGAGVSTLVAGWRLALDYTDTNIDPESPATRSHTILSIGRGW